MADHSELVAEITSVEKMATPDRLKHAKKRRNQQMKRWATYEKQIDKDRAKKNKQSSSQRRPPRKRARGVKFIHNVMILEAAARNDVEEVRKLLMAGVGPDVTNEDGLTALHQCCIDDSEAMLQLLLEFRANVNAQDSEQWTPLHAAATCAHVHLCKHLIEKGADLLAVNADGNMPYDICEDEVTLDYIETEMAKRGVTQEEIDEKRLEIERRMLRDLKKLAAEGGNLEFRDANRATPLHVAAANGYVEVVEYLLEQHVALDVRDYDSWMPIHAAACWLQPEVMEQLVKHGADLGAKTRHGETAFDLAEDPDMKQKILDIQDELETHKASNPRDRIPKHRVSSRSHYSSTGSLYSSTGSLNDKPAPAHSHSASVRRTSVRREKQPLSKKEAKEEALHMFRMTDDDDEMPDIDEKENVPATNLDDVTITIIDEPDKYVPKEPERPEKPVGVRDNDARDVRRNKQPDHRDEAKDRRSQERPRDPDRRDIAQDPARQVNGVGRSKDGGRSEGKQDSRSRREQVASANTDRNDVSAPRTSRPVHDSHSPQDGRRDRDPGREPRRESRDTSPGQRPAPKLLQGQTGPGTRVPSFRKNRDSQRRTRDDTSPPETNRNNYPVSGGMQHSGSTGTLSDLKKQRSEQHKVGNGLDAQVQNLFLMGLSGEGQKYSQGTRPSPSPSSGSDHSRDHSDNNARNVKNNNNNVSERRPPPTFIRDGGPLRKFSAPTNHPVIGDDDKFKGDCCVIV